MRCAGNVKIKKDKEFKFSQKLASFAIKIYNINSFKLQAVLFKHFQAAFQTV